MPNRLPVTTIVGALLLLSMPAEVYGQYFGRQKVQYESFDWRVITAPNFDVHFYPSEEVAARDAARMAERWYVRHANSFQHEFDRKPLIFYADAPDFQQTNVISGMIGEGTGGVTESLRTRVIMPFTGIYAETDHVLGHEMVHVFQYDLASSPGGGGFAGLSQLPLWFIEGMAEYLSVGRQDPHTALWMRDAALNGVLPTIADLSRSSRYFPYRYGQALFAYIGGRWGDRAVPELYVRATRQGVEGAFQSVLGISSAELSEAWIEAVRAAYLPAIQGRQRPEDAGSPLLVDDEPGAMNLSPSVSPDGRLVAYYGKQGLFSIDLLIADVETGEVIRELASPATDQHYDALSFISTSGTWSPDGRRIAFVVYANGDNQLTIANVENGNIERRIDLAEIGAIQHPAWSPDGRTIALSGQRGGITDLYLLDLESETLRQLTNDRYADLQPAWSPDGRTLAFVTDRATGTDFDRLSYGPMALALLDVTSLLIRPLPIFEGAKHIDPHFSVDGSSIFFVSNREGFSDLYRYDLSTGAAYQVTHLATGVSGITALSPAITVASNGRLLFSAFENSGYHIYRMDAAATSGTPAGPVDPRIAAAAGSLPPSGREDLVHSYLNDPLAGLPASREFTTEPYRTSLDLEYLGPPSVGVGLGSFGTQLSGSAAAFFGDMLGNHQLGVALQASGTAKDIGGQAVYQNLGNRVNWGVGAGHIPYLSVFTAIGTGQVDGQPVTVVDQSIERTYVQRAQLFAQYPLSTTRRLEASGGYVRYAFGREIDRYFLDNVGRVLDLQQIDTTAPDPINFFQSALAFVTDNSFFGFTSPVQGSRSRFEVAPTIGTLDYFTLLGDYRRYMLAQPVSFAFRALHFGRYGKNASGHNDDGERILSPLFVGDPYLIRGYTQGSFGGDECDTTPGSNDCPAFDRLVGTRVAVANFEVRIPLLGTADYGLLNVPFLPTEIAPFFDAGLAWSAGDEVDFDFLRNTRRRVPVFSTGISARMNLFGYLVLETYYAYPFQRPKKGGHFGLQLNPGW
jgi:WD40 repeat protein